MAKNRMSKLVGMIERLPTKMQSPALSVLLGRVVKFLGTSGIQVHSLTQHEAVMSLANRTKVQNHIKGVHAAAMALLAESATGFVTGMNVPDDKILVIKSLHVDYVKRAQGDLRAVAQLTDEQIAQITSQEKGEVTVAVTITDERGTQPVQCEMI